MPWLMLFLAGTLEVCWAVGLKQGGFNRLLPAFGTVLAMTVSLVLLGIVMRSVPLSTAYAVWTGIGVAGTALAGWLLFGEQLGWPRLVCLMLIILGIAGLKLFEPAVRAI